jgi:putative component of toxin-antitoxin plasmid stabilization module
LTYMSIREEWQKLVVDGLLSKLAPFPGDPRARTVLMSKEIWELVESPWEGEQGNRCAKLLATLQNIVAGRKLVVNLNPYSARDAVMGRLHPVEEGIWDIRGRDRPGLRIFCAFLETGRFDRIHLQSALNKHSSATSIASRRWAITSVETRD